MELPVFKYHIDSIQSKVIVKEKTFCPVCEEEKEYKYELNPYSEHNLEGICPWCIANGAAYRKFGAEFNDYHVEPFQTRNFAIPQTCIDELVQRTPTYLSWQTEVWLDCCQDICSFKDYVGWKEIECLYEEIKHDIEIIIEQMGLTLEEFKVDLVNEGWHQGYLFQCRHCQKHRLYTDVG